ncbi:hypothetical protein KUTeg_006723, partial [Tegillarca granosa]
METLTAAACAYIDSEAEALYKLSQEIWKNPELNYEEFYAHDILCSFLEKRGFNVERKYLLNTAFRAKYGEPGTGPNICVICEYDALPEIGHGCGHNLIAEVGVAAGIGVKAALEKADQPIGQVTVLGCPAEEGGGGKVRLIDNGAFHDIDVAMMAHPAPTDGVFPTLAADTVTVTFHGHAVHAAAFPWQGVNALDAAVLCYQNVSCMRQQMKPTWRISGIISNGGAKPNIIPETAECEYIIRTQSKTDLDILRSRTIDCFESAAKATGCTVEYKFWEKPYLNVIQNKELSDLYTNNLRKLGKDLNSSTAPVSEVPLGSTDMGNVSYIVPSIHPFFNIGTNALNHTHDFTTAA